VAGRALREGFVRDVATHLEGVTLYQRGLAEDGAIIPLPRRQPLPTYLLLALGTIVWIHCAAKPEVTEDWEGYVCDWLSDIAERIPTALEASSAPPYMPVGPYPVPSSAGSDSHQRQSLDHGLDLRSVPGAPPWPLGWFSVWYSPRTPLRISRRERASERFDPTV
jgi:hypothetical protein